MTKRKNDEKGSKTRAKPSRIRSCLTLFLTLFGCMFIVYLFTDAPSPSERLSATQTAEAQREVVIVPTDPFDAESAATELPTEAVALSSTQPPTDGFSLTLRSQEDLPTVSITSADTVASQDFFTTATAVARSLNLVSTSDSVQLSPLPTTVSGNMAVTSAPPEIFYTGSTANARTCENTTCDVAFTLPVGITVSVIGWVEGETFRGDSTWGRIIYEGQMLYIHRALLTTNPPPPTSVPAQPQPVLMSTPVQGQVWNCNGNLYNCSDFASYRDVMSYWNACPGDPSGLDRDRDGQPCDPTNWD